MGNSTLVLPDDILHLDEDLIRARSGERRDLDGGRDFRQVLLVLERKLDSQFVGVRLVERDAFRVERLDGVLQVNFLLIGAGVAGDAALNPDDLARDVLEPGGIGRAAVHLADDRTDDFERRRGAQQGGEQREQ